MSGDSDKYAPVDDGPPVWAVELRDRLVADPLVQGIAMAVVLGMTPMTDLAAAMEVVLDA